MWKKRSPPAADPVRPGPADPAGVELFYQYSLLGMLASGYAAVAGSGMLDPVTAFLMLGALAARLVLLNVKPFPVLPAAYTRAATLAYLGFYPLDYVWISREFVPATVHLVFFVAVVLLISGRTSRDLFFLKTIAFLELLAASILSSSLNFFLFLVAFLMFAAATFAGAEILRAARGRRVVDSAPHRLARPLAWLSVLTVLGVLLMTAGLFVVLPRTARAALDRLAPYGTRVAGYANEVTLGHVGEIERRSTPLLHLKFIESREPRLLRLRGGALGEFNGIRWYNSARLAELKRPQAGLVKVAGDDWLRRLDRPRLDYQVIQSPAAGDSLFTAGTPEYLRVPGGPVWQMPTGGFRLPGVSVDGLRYAVYAVALPDSTGLPPAPPAFSPDDRNFYLRLPPVDPRVTALAQSLTAGRQGDDHRAQAIEDYLRANYRYSLRALREEVADPLAYFLLEGRQGHCEYFASAMAVMLRLQWIPARVATGFLGGDLNPLTSWTVVRASNAHSWVEAWIPGRGWVAYDPTPPSGDANASSAWSRLGIYLDAAQTFWQEWVLGYDLERQWTLAFRVDESRRRWEPRWPAAFQPLADAARRSYSWALRHGLAVIAAAAAIVLLILAGPRLLRLGRRQAQRQRLRRGRASASDASRIYQRLLETLRRRGWDKPAHLTPAEFAASIPEPAARARVDAFTRAYNDLRFGGRFDQAPLLASLLDEIERQSA